MVKIYLIDDKRKDYAIEEIRKAEIGHVCEINPPSKTREQEERYHAMLGDIARQCTQFNQSFSLDDWKRLCVDMFAKDCISQNVDRIAEYFIKNKVKIVPALDGSGTVVLGNQTRKFPKYVAIGFIEWLQAFGAERQVKWGLKDER